MALRLFYHCRSNAMHSQDDSNDCEVVSLSDCSTAELLDMMLLMFSDPEIREDCAEVLRARGILSTSPSFDLVHALHRLYSDNFKGLPYQ
jgi:hypothetical protein